VPYKAKPADPGGMEVRHQDSTVFDSLDKKAEVKKVEKLLPAQEEPLDKAKIPLAASTPKLNLEPQMKSAGQEMKPAGQGIEKVVSPIVAASAPVEEKAVTMPEAKPVPVFAPVAGGVHMQFGSYRTIASAEAEWKQLQRKYPQFMQGLHMRAERADLGARGIFYRLQVGALPVEAAQKTCESIKKSGGCMVVK
jgi:hypothetical protein